MEVTLQQVLAAREARRNRQQALLAQYKTAVLCFTMNIAGPVKNDPLITWGFHYGSRLLRAQLDGSHLKTLHHEQTLSPTGCEGFWVVDAPPSVLKALACQIEDCLPVGRLFDMDVLSADGVKIDRQAVGYPPRKCLLCEQPAFLCSRSRAHGLPLLQEKTRSLLWAAYHKDWAEALGTLAVRSLLYEVCVTPKPGLVDRTDSGSHQDMDIFSFMSSAAVLSPYFIQCVHTGMDTAHEPPAETFQALRFPGKVAEQAMYQAAGGANTHKGAIFSLGLLCAAAGRTGVSEPATILRECAAMTAGITKEELGVKKSTAGEALYAAYGITGIRGQAEAGFPVVLNTGLPILRQCVDRGMSINDAGAVTLMHLMLAAEDTNLLKRAGMESYQQVKLQLEDLLRTDPYPHTDTIQQWNAAFRSAKLSPGGSADLLALTFFLHFLEKETSYGSIFPYPAVTG